MLCVFYQNAYFPYVRTKKSVIDKYQTVYNLYLKYDVDDEKIWIDTTYQFYLRIYVDRHDLSIGFPFETGPRCKIVDYVPLDKVKKIKAENNYFNLTNLICLLYKGG